MRGSIVKRSKDSWTVILNLGRDPATGKRKQQWVTVRGTKRDAERKLAELQHQLDTGSFIKPSKLTVAEHLRDWIRDYAAMTVRPRTFEGYSMIVEKHLIPSLGGIVLSQLQPSSIQEYYAKALKDGRSDGKGGLSARTVKHHHRVLSEALAYGVRMSRIFRNVAQAVMPPRPVNQEMNTLDEAEMDDLLEAAKGTPYYHLFHLALYTGLRRSELLGLRWKDVDLYLANLSVTQVMHRLQGGQVVFLEPKTAKSRRQVSLTPDSAIALREHYEQQKQERGAIGILLNGDSLVFSRLDGTPLPPITVNHAFIRIMKKAGLEGIRMHDLRHTHATLMMKQGVNPKIVQERLGHSSFAVTMDVYSHVVPGLQEAAALGFDQGVRRHKNAGQQVGAGERG
jgi:integrase